MYALLHTIFDLLFRLLTRRTAIGLENIPLTGPVLLVTNHLSILDPPLIFTQINRPDMVVFVADKYKKNPLFRWIIENIGGVWVDRGNVDRATLKASLEVLRRGGLLGMAPEGTRSRTKRLHAGKTGAAYLASRAGAPILPVAVFGTEQVFRGLLRLRRVGVTFRAGKPFTLPPLARDERADQLEALTTEIMCRIAALLPPEYRGVYRDHERVRELELELELERRS